MKLPREAQATLAGLILFVIFSFFDWQQVSYFGHTGGETLWHGFGIITVADRDRVPDLGDRPGAQLRGRSSGR